MWVEFARNPQGYFCFCEETRKCFRLWLQKRYGTLEALGKAWGHRLTDWEDVRPPTWAFGYADTVDWRLFTTENIAELVKRRTDYIRKYSPVQVIAHAWGGGTVTCGQLGAMAFDDWKNSQPLDKWGCSAFPSNITHTCNVGLSMDSTRSAAQGKEFWQSELSAGDVAGGMRRALYAPPETFAIWCWEAIGHGSKGLLFWQFRKESYGNESGAYGLTDYQGNPTPRALTASKIAKTLNDNAELFNHAEMPQADVAILFSYQSVMLNWAEYRNNNLSVDAIGGYYRAFWERNIPVDILHEEFTTADMLSRYKMVVLPCPFTLPKRVTELLEKFVTDGGTVFSDPMLCLWDEHQKLSDHIPGNGLHTLFGCEEDMLMTGNQGAFEVLFDGCRIPLKNSFARETWKITQESAKTMVSDGNGQPLIVAAAHGKGHAVLSGISLGNMASQQISISDDFHREGTEQDNRGAAELILEVAKLANVTVPIEAPLNIRVRHMVSNGKHILIVYEFQKKATEATLEFAAANDKPWTNLLDGATGRFQNGKASLSFTPNEVKVLVF
jgi:beta-galactosidase GanA